jgi:hypothetical protein
MRTFYFEMLFAGIQLGVLHVSSQANPADEPSRNRREPAYPDTRNPVVQAWAREFLAGNISALDPHLPRASWERLVLPLGATPGPAPPDQWNLSAQEFRRARPSETALSQAAVALDARLLGDPVPESQLERWREELLGRKDGAPGR